MAGSAVFEVIRGAASTKEGPTRHAFSGLHSPMYWIFSASLSLTEY